MKPFEIAPGVHWIGVKHPDLRLFDDLMPTPTGTTYNAYLVRGKQVAVIDAVKGMFSDEFMANLSSLVNPKDVDVIVVNHTEPDHSGALGRLLEAAPKARVFATRPARLYMKDLLNRVVECCTIEDCPEVDLGGLTLRFMAAPFLHWPDTMFTWLPERRLLFTCDAFGAHHCAEGMYNDQTPKHEPDFRVYYDALMRVYRDKVVAAVERLQDVDFEMICPSHGPILRKEPRRYVELYRQWATLKPREKPLIAVFYASAHGKTMAMAESIAEGARKLDVEVQLLHVTESSDAQLRDAMESADGLLFGSPTIVRDIPGPMWRALGLLSSVKPAARHAAAFGSYGWSGEVVGMIERRLHDMRLPVVESKLRVRFTPTANDLDDCRAFGEQFASAVAAG